MNQLKKLAIVTTHPIQYNAPFFAALSKKAACRVKVFYTWGQTAKGQVYDPGFGSSFKWDLPLLEGYEFEFLNNISKNPGSNHFSGIINPDAISKLENWRPDVILVYGWCFQSHFKIMRYFSGRVPIWFRGDSTLLDEPVGFSFKKIIRRIFLRYVYHNVDKALYVGIANKKYFLAHGMKSEKLIYLPHTVDNFRFCESDTDQLQQLIQLRSQFGIKIDDIVFLYVGKLDENKRPHLLAENLIKLANPKIHFIFVGDGKIRKQLESNFGNYNNIHFVGFQNQSKIPLYYKLCDLFFLVSKSETWGLAINEAMASGKAVVASGSCGGAFDLIENKKNGWIFKSDDSSELYEIMEESISLGKSHLLDMGIISSEKIKKFSLDNNVNIIDKIISEI